MGIELPIPQGEQPNRLGAEYSAPRAVETRSNGQSVEQNTTERPASQELRTGQGAGENTSPQSYIAVDDTTSTTAPSTAQPASTTLSLDDVPAVAADDDLIEKQWVESVKLVVRQTRSDPYQQGEAIGRLQADYLQKRYGKVIGSGNSE